MKLTTANKICKKLSAQYGIIKPPKVIPLKYSHMGKHVALGYFDEVRNTIEINQYAMELWNSDRIQEIISHELIHTRCYQDFGHTGHGARFRLLCDLYGVDGDARMATSKRSR
jgi:predicted SprT family Zn-dependent metalloprotease